MNFMLVASSGGHLAELFALRELWSQHQRLWISFPTEDARHLLAGERVCWAHYPTNRNIGNLVRNLGLALRVLVRERADVVLSTGAGVAVPFLWVGRALGAHTMYLESITRIAELSLTGKLVYPIVDRFLVQWEELAQRVPRAEYWGQVA